MANSNVPMFPQTIESYAVAINNGSGTTPVTIVTGGTQGTKVEFLNAANSDSSNAYTLTFNLNNGTSNFPIGTVNIPLNSGEANGVAPLNVLASGAFSSLPKDANNNPYIYVMNGYTLNAAVSSTVTSGKQISFTGHGGNY